MPGRDDAGAADDPDPGAAQRREIEVAALAAAGMANKEIACRLSVSVRTVENHLQRVYEKLGVARRADLGGALSSL